VLYRSVNGRSVTVSLSQVATRSKISERTFFDATAAASNSQSDFVYRCRLSSGSPYFCITEAYHFDWDLYMECGMKSLVTGLRDAGCSGC
jgi:hypothetical protein